MTYESNRRSLLKHAALAAAGLAATGCTNNREQTVELGRQTPLWPSNTTILFQGDSITDAGRSKKKASAQKAGAFSDAQALGQGYAFIAAAQLMAEPSGQNLQVVNRGISGNKVYQLAERWQEDCLDLKPHILSILVGVNDYWHTFARDYQGTVETYERDYHALLARTRQALPEIQFVVCEPFVMHCGAVEDTWFPELDHYQAAALRVAQEAKAFFVPFQSVFNDALNYAPAEHWAADGVHPTSAGSALMAQAWLQTVKGNLA